MVQAARYAFPPNLFLSRSARESYKFAAIGSFLFLFAYIRMYVLLGFHALKTSNSVAVFLLRSLLLVGALCVAAVCVSMEYYCFRFDKSSAVARAVWFSIMIVGSPIACLLYFYVVYLPQTRLTQAQALSATNSN